MQHNYLHYNTKKIQYSAATINTTYNGVLTHRRERERKGKKNYIYKYTNEKKREIKVKVCMALPLHVD